MPALVVSYSSAAGGSERLLLDVATGLADRPVIACPEGWLADEARGLGFTVIALEERSLQLRRSRRDRVAAGWRLGAHAREIRRLARDLAPTVVVAWGMRTALAAAAGLRGVGQPWIFEHVDFAPGPLIGRALHAAASRADRVVCISRAIAADLDPDGRLGERIEVVHCGVDVARFGGTDAGGGADTGSTDALLLGAIVGWKRPDLALEAVALAARRLPDLRLTIAGAPLDEPGEELLERLRARAAKPDLDGRVEFAGRLPDPRAALAEAGCLLHCADREPFGLVLVEALASGTPVVAPDSGGPAEIVDASCGALYPPGDATAAADALVRVLGDRARLSDGARVRAADAFSLERMQARYRELIEQPDAADARGGTAADARGGTAADARGGTAADARGGTAADARGAGVAVVTVTYNSARELERLSASLRRHLPGARLVVVDNASDDDSVAVARAAGATVIARADNAGFGRAANEGVAVVEEPVTILCNPDVELVDGSLERLVAQAVPGRLLAPLLLNDDGSRQDSAHPPPASPATALHALLPGPLLPRPLRRACEPWRATKARRVAWATAACIVATTDTLRALGPFDESIFLYAEDLDLGIRARETWFHPEARVVHSRAHSTGRAFSGENYDLLAKQRRDVVRRNFGPVRAILDDVIELTTFADRSLLRRLSGRSTRNETERFRARLRAAVKR